MKAENLHSLERAEQIKVRWRFGVKDRRCSVDFVQSSSCSECHGCGEAWQIEVVCKVKLLFNTPQVFDCRSEFLIEGGF